MKRVTLPVGFRKNTEHFEGKKDAEQRREAISQPFPWFPQKERERQGDGEAADLGDVLPNQVGKQHGPAVGRAPVVKLTEEKDFIFACERQAALVANRCLQQNFSS